MTATQQREAATVRKEQAIMNDATQARRRMLIKAVHHATCELATRYMTVAPDDQEPMPDEPVIMVPCLDKRNPKMVAIRSLAIFERIRLTIPNVTLQEVQDAIIQNLPYIGGGRQ
jgi:hypothetical protein